MVEEAGAMVADLPAADWLGYVPKPLSTGSRSSTCLTAFAFFSFLSPHFFTELK